MTSPFARPHRDDLRDMLRLALPVVISQLGMMLMGVVDTVMVGHYSATDLAAVALGNLYFVSVYAFGLGVLMSLDPLVSQAVGSGDRSAVVRAVQRGLLIAFGLSVPLTVALWPGELVFTFLHQPKEIIPTAATYARICIPGLLPFLGFIVLKQTLQAMQKVRPVVIVIFAANLLNVLLNWLLIFGGMGLEPMGAIGSAWASTASRWFLALSLFLLARDQLGPLLRRLDPVVLQTRPLWRMFVLGVPIGIQHCIEFGAFATIALFMGWMGAVPLAAHQVALYLAALSFMVPLGVSAAAAVHVGNAIGRGDQSGARRAASAALICGGGFMVFTAVIFLTIPGPLASIFTNAGDVIAVALVLIPIAGFFQIFDGLQVVAGGILRGMGDTRAPMVLNVLGFWFAGVPVSLWLGFKLEMGPAGLWYGFVAGLGAVAILLLFRVSIKLRRPVDQVLID